MYYKKKILLIGSISLFFLVIIITLFFCSFKKKFFDLQVENFINDKIIGFAKIKINKTKLLLNNGKYFSLQLYNAKILPFDKNIQIENFGTIDLFFSIKSLVFGKIQVKKIIFQDFNINVVNFKKTIQLINFLSNKKKPNFDDLSNSVFSFMDYIYDRSIKNSLEEIIFKNFTVYCNDNKILLIKDFKINNFKNQVKTFGEISVKKTLMKFKSFINIDSVTHVKTFDIFLNNIPFSKNFFEDIFLKNSEKKIGTLNVHLVGKKNLDSNFRNLKFYFNILYKNIYFCFKKRKLITISLKANYFLGSRKIEIFPSKILIDNFEFLMNGKIFFSDKLGEYSFVLFVKNNKNPLKKSSIRLSDFSLNSEGYILFYQKKIFFEKFFLKTKEINFQGNGKINYKEYLEISCTIKQNKISLKQTQNFLGKFIPEFSKNLIFSKKIENLLSKNIIEILYDKNKIFTIKVHSKKIKFEKIENLLQLSNNFFKNINNFNKNVVPKILNLSTEIKITLIIDPISDIKIKWNANIIFNNFSCKILTKKIIYLKDTTAKIYFSDDFIDIQGKGYLDNVFFTCFFHLPTKKNFFEKKIKVVFHIDEKIKNRSFPFLKQFVSGNFSIEINDIIDSKLYIIVDLLNSSLKIPKIGWKKNIGSPAKIAMQVEFSNNNLNNFKISCCKFNSKNLNFSGNVSFEDGSLISAEFFELKIQKENSLQLSIKKKKKTYIIKFFGKYFNLQHLIKNFRFSTEELNNYLNIEILINFEKVSGFYNEELTKFRFFYKKNNVSDDNLFVTGITRNNNSFFLKVSQHDNNKNIIVSSKDAGTILRFAKIYNRIYNGILEVNLKSIGNGPLTGPISIRKFQIINEPNMKSSFSLPMIEGKKNVDKEIQEKIKIKNIFIDKAFGSISKGKNYLFLDEGIVYGPTIGITFQGNIYDVFGNIDITGTFIPGYSLNSIFGNVPILGMFLGNGRDNGLIGITFKIKGSNTKPQINVNPVSIIAPGIFRSLFEFH